MPRPTGRGIGFSLLTLFVYLAANQTRMGWLYLVAATMAAVLVFSFVIPWFATRGPTITRVVAPPNPTGPTICEDDRVEIRLTLRAGLACYFVRVTDHCPLDAPGSQQKAFFCWRVGPQELTLSYSVSCYKRGRHKVGPVTVESAGFFGLFHCRRLAPVFTEVRVLPWHLPAQQALALTRQLQAADGRRAIRGSGGEVYATRDYRPLDPLRAIHWRSTARRGSLIVKDFARLDPAALTVLLDSSAEFGTGKDTTLEYSIKAAASLAHWAAAQGWQFHLIAPGFPNPLASLPQTLDFLTRLQVTLPAGGLPALLHRTGRAEALVLLSPAAADRARLAGVRYGRKLCLRVAFTEFESNGLSTPAHAITGITTIAWPKGRPPAEIISEIITECATSRVLWY